MGVLECNRNGCENIMCDYHSDKFGYLCSDCKRELLSLNSRFNSIGVFMRSYKEEEDVGMKEYWDNLVNKEFKGLA